MFVFKENSVNGSGSIKVFTWDGDIQSLIDFGVPDRFKNNGNTAFVVEATDGTYQVIINDDAAALTVYQNIEAPLPLEAFEGAITTNGPSWTTIYTFGVGAGEHGQYNFTAYAERQGGEGLFRRAREGLYQEYQGALTEKADTIYSNQISALGLSVRERVQGSNIEIQVKGRAGQDWDWRIYGTVGAY